MGDNSEKKEGMCRSQHQTCIERELDGGDIKQSTPNITLHDLMVSKKLVDATH